MLPKSKIKKIHHALKNYSQKYIKKKTMELDESGTRLMINSFLTDVLGYEPIEETKTEYMIKGTYADYVVQIKGTRHFLVEVKSLSLSLSEKHLRQTINYGANEGIEWALLTNGKYFELYRIIFNKPIEAKKVFSLDLGNLKTLKDSVELLQFMHRDAINKKGMDILWNKCVALEPITISGLLYADPVVRFVKKILNKKFKYKFTEEEVVHSIKRVIEEAVNADGIKATRVRKQKRKKKLKVSEYNPNQTTQAV